MNSTPPRPNNDSLRLDWRCGAWSELADLAEKVRESVFVAEMNIDRAEDIDGTDDGAIHIVALHGQVVVATGRLHLADARIGRMAVLRDYRLRGIGSQTLTRLLDSAIVAGFKSVSLHAQTHAIPFYERHGFAIAGEEFYEAQIPHRLMRRSLEWTPAVAAVIAREGRVALGLRAPHTILGNCWDLFGGRVEPGEGDSQALVRELREELAIEAVVGPLLDVCLYRDPATGAVFRSPVFAVVEWTGEFRLNDEHTAVREFAPETLAGLCLAHPAIPEMAEAVLHPSLRKAIRSYCRPPETPR